MQLFLNKASPYARLVLAVAHEKNLADRIELVWTDPWASEQSLLTVTPLAKVPALVAEDGEPIVESGCICEYLDTIGQGRPLRPNKEPERLADLRKYGLGRGLIDVAFSAVIQKRYAAGADPMLESRWRIAVTRTVEWLEQHSHQQAEPGLGEITIAVALSYVDFRLGELDWRHSAPKLAGWFVRMSERESMKRTAPE